MTTTHDKYDEYFYKMCALMAKGDSFDADVLDVSDWNTRFGELSAYVKKVNLTLKGEKAIRKVLATLFFCDDVFTYLGDAFDYAKYLDFVSLCDSALSNGFIPDCVCPNGPSPNTSWTINVTPLKSMGKRTLTPGPMGPSVSFTVSPPLTPAPVVPPPPVFGHPPAAPPANPSSQAVSQALLDFLQGGSMGASLPRSPYLGMPPSIELPVLLPPASEWLAPSVTKIYDLAAFLPATGSTKPKLASPKDWVAAAHQFGQALSASPKDHEFVWPDFICYIELTTVLFEHYEFSAVVAHDCSWRRWRRAYKKSWCSSNPFLRDVHLLGHDLRPKAPAPALIKHLSCLIS